MARLWSSGFELNSTTANVEWTAVTGSPTIQTTTVHAGTYAMQCNTAATTANLTYDFLASGGNTNNHYFRFYLRIASAPDATNTIFLTRDVAAAVSVVGIRLDTDRTLILRDAGNNTNIGSASSALSLDTWYRVELEYQYHASTPTVKGYLNGSEFASGTLVDNANNNPSRIVLGTQSSSTGNLFFDCMAINDSTGSFQNALAGEGEIIHLRPNAAGDAAAWNAGTGSTFAQVDEVTPDDATTIIRTPAIGSTNVSEFEIDDTPSALASDDTINCVHVGFRGAGNTVGTNADDFVLRIKSASGGTVQEGSTVQYATNTYTTNAIAVPRNYTLTLYDLPGASTTAWTKATLDTAQIGVGQKTSDTARVNVSTLWLLVDHKPAGEVEPPAEETTHVGNLLLMGVG